VQRRFINILPEFQDVHYEEALKNLELNKCKKEETWLISFFYTRCTKALLNLLLNQRSNLPATNRLEDIYWN